MDYNYYGVYKNTINAAWQCLIDMNIRQLPVSLMDIAKKANIKMVENSAVNELEENESGISILHNGRWAVVFDDTRTYDYMRYIVAHEFGHIFLGHELKYKRNRLCFTGAKEKSEREADMFAIRLLAPACVLWGLDLHSADDIAKICVLPIYYAKKRAERMKVLYERNKFFTSSVEKNVYNNFNIWIENYRNGLI